MESQFQVRAGQREETAQGIVIAESAGEDVGEGRMSLDQLMVLENECRSAPVLAECAGRAKDTEIR